MWLLTLLDKNKKQQNTNPISHHHSFIKPKDRNKKRKKKFKVVLNDGNVEERKKEMD